MVINLNRIADIGSQLFFNLFLIAWFGGIFYIAITTILRSYNEKQAFKAMIANPNNDTVTNYIEAYKKTNGFVSVIVNLAYSQHHRSNQQRQAQGFETIKNSNA